MSQIWSFIVEHQTIATLVAYYVAIAFVGSLPAPTANSTQLYRFFYQFANTLGGNLTRAFASKVESSPNFVDAMNIQNAKAGSDKRVVEMPVEAKT
jgi:hypothetical protein